MGRKTDVAYFSSTFTDVEGNRNLFYTRINEVLNLRIFLTH